MTASSSKQGRWFFRDFGQIWRIPLFLFVVSLVACGGGAGSGGGGGLGGGVGGGGGGSGSNGAFAAGRTRYVRTDATTEYSQWINSHWVVYSPTTARFFVTDPFSNHVIVMDARSETKIGVISVPGAYGIDDTPDHAALYVGTLIGDVYSIDPVSMTVTKRYVASQIGPAGFFATSAVVLADGRLALLGGPGGIPSVDGFAGVAIWSPVNNSLTLHVESGCSSFMGSIGGFSRSVDRTKVIVTGINNGTLCEIDEASGQGSSVQTQATFTMYNFRITPDGKYIVVPLYPTSASVYDAQTLAQVAQFSVNGDSSSASGFFISADSRTLFTPNSTIVYAYDLSNQQQTGWLPNMNVQNTSSGGAEGPISSPNLQATDGTGLFIGPLEEGVGFIDTTVMRSGTVGTQFANGYLSPATGPMSGGTSVQLPDPNTFGSLSAMFFGSQRATNLSGGSGLISATTPTGNPGPVDVWTFTTDGGFQLLPEGFSYGPTILEVSANMSTAEGGGTGFIFGYGFGPIASGTAVPSSLQVTVGGTPVQLTALNSSTGAPPFQLQAIAYTIPPGPMGTTSDVTVTSSSGSTTAHAALSYLPSVQQFALPGSALAQGIYDPYRDVYYFTDANKIQIFSKTQGQWLAPISIPAPNGAVQRLWGIALSPNGSLLAVADAMAGVIYVLSPTSPASVRTFAVNTGSVGLVFPCGVAISDAGVVYYAVFWQGISGAKEILKLDTNTGAIKDYGIGSSGLATDQYLRTVISSDNSRVFFNDDGYVFYIDTQTDQIVSASVDVGCCYGDYELALSANQSEIEATGYLYDSHLNGASFLSLNDRETQTAQYVYGNKFSFDGRLLFQPSVRGIDIFDGRVGNLLERISLAAPLSQNYDALVVDGKDNVLVAITGANGSGIAVVDLTSVPQPTALPFVTGSPHQAQRLLSWADSRLSSKETNHLNSPERSLLLAPQIPHLTAPSVTSPPRAGHDRM